MLRRVIASFAAVSAVLAMTSAVLAAPFPKVPAGSKVFIAPMDARQDTTVSMTRIASGEAVFTHSVTTLVRSQGKSARIFEAGGHGQTPNRLLHAGKQTAARQCVKAMQATFTEK
jgi:hypothetical protein